MSEDPQRILDIEITVRMMIPGAVSKADLAEHYNTDPLQCAKELIESGGLMGATSKRFDIVSATLVEGASKRK